MALLTAPTTTMPRAALLRTRSAAISTTLRPPVTVALQFRHVLGLLLRHICFAAREFGIALFTATKVVVLNIFRVLRSSTTRSVQLTWTLWDSKRSRRIRKKLELEFFVLILGPGGNSLLLLLFWPGWLILIIETTKPVLPQSRSRAFASSGKASGSRSGNLGRTSDGNQRLATQRTLWDLLKDLLDTCTCLPLTMASSAGSAEEYEFVDHAESALTLDDIAEIRDWLRPTDYLAESGEFRRHLVS
ncbi:hypothetical protein B0H63DRAFT_559934 [Podospora didyma]|uniref:Uncharacterized protein n=1 Tax=Podospora didyma TaxID=330526 RepID=A0AAE0TZE8_9PEZI|nr:hypothetical protein B0H63DRAFT_559934 [Podospora didyma]